MSVKGGGEVENRKGGKAKYNQHLKSPPPPTLHQILKPVGVKQNVHEIHSSIKMN